MKKWLLLLVCCFSSLVAEATPLPAAEVFKMQVKKIDPNTFSLNWIIKSGYFLYSDRIKLAVEKDSAIHLGTVRFPPTESKTDAQGHTFTIYRNEVSVPVAILGNSPGETLLNIGYQGCSDDGFCYPPETRKIKLAIDSSLGISAIDLEQNDAVTPVTSNDSRSQIEEVFASHDWVKILFVFYGFGLLLSFTPCILPMVPVLSGIIVGHGGNVTTKKAFFLSLSYVLSMSVTYAVVGAIVALLGANVQISMQSPWAISIFSLIFVLLALSMFGFYEFKLPDSWQSKIAGSSRTQRGGHYLGAALMGCLSTLILSPCVTAPLIGVLTYIAQTGNVLLGSLTLFVLSLGMGTPLLLIGTSAGKWLPQSGSWMNAVKAFFGVLLIAVAIFLMSRILPNLITMGLWGSLLIFSGIFSGAFSSATTHKEKFCQGVGIILLAYGVLILVGASLGSGNPLQPLTNTQAAVSPIAEPKNQTLASIQEAISQAHGKPVMLDFYADWCASCKVMEATTFQDARVQEALNQFVVIKVDVTANNAADKAIMAEYNIVAPPTFVFFNGQGSELSQFKLVGERTADEFLQELKQIKTQS